MTSPEPLVSAWEHLGHAQLALDTATATDAPLDDRFEALASSISNVVAAVHVTLRELATRHARSSP